MKLYDPFAGPEMPDDVRALLERATPAPAPAAAPPVGALEGIPGIPAAAPPPAPAAPLNHWEIQTHVYRTEAEAKVSFLGALFTGATKAVSAGVVQEAKFYRIERTAEHKVEIGVAVRLVLAATDFDVSAELSVPNLVAAAQLSKADTRVGIHVVGSSVSVGDLIPTPTTINVENHQLFLEAFAKIRERVFAQENEAHFVPEVLAMEEVGDPYAA